MLKSFLQMYEKDGSGPLGGFFIPAAQTKLPSAFSPGSSFLPSLVNKVSPGTGDGKRTELEEITLDLLLQEDGATGM